MLRLSLGAISTANTPMQNSLAPRVSGGGLPDAPPGAVTNPYGGVSIFQAPLQSGMPTSPGTTVVVSDPGGGPMPGRGAVIPVSPGPIILQPTPTSPPQVIVDPIPPSAGTQFTTSPQPSLFDSISAQLTPTRIFAAALAIGAAAIGAVVVTRVRRHGGTAID